MPACAPVFSLRDSLPQRLPLPVQPFLCTWTNRKYGVKWCQIRDENGWLQSLLGRAPMTTVAMQIRISQTKRNLVVCKVCKNGKDCGTGSQHPANHAGFLQDNGAVQRYAVSQPVRQGIMPVPLRVTVASALSAYFLPSGIPYSVHSKLKMASSSCGLCGGVVNSHVLAAETVRASVSFPHLGPLIPQTASPLF